MTSFLSRRDSLLSRVFQKLDFFRGLQTSVYIPTQNVMQILNNVNTQKIIKCVVYDRNMQYADSCWSPSLHTFLLFSCFMRVSDETILASSCHAEWRSLLCSMGCPDPLPENKIAGYHNPCLFPTYSKALHDKNHFLHKNHFLVRNLNTAHVCTCVCSQNLVGDNALQSE
jgi:hypothetical protein